MKTFRSTNLFCCFSRYQVPANSVAPPSVYKPHTTHNFSIRSDEGLTLETSALESLYGGQFTLSTQLIKPNYHVKNEQHIDIGSEKTYGPKNTGQLNIIVHRLQSFAPLS